MPAETGVGLRVVLAEGFGGGFCEHDGADAVCGNAHIRGGGYAGDGYFTDSGKNDSDVEIIGDEIVPFERIRRITGYLVGTLDRFNNAKRAEEHDRVKHGLYREADSPARA